jgi:hypothetical protein
LCSLPCRPVRLHRETPSVSPRRRDPPPPRGDGGWQSLKRH